MFTITYLAKPSDLQIFVKFVENMLDFRSEVTDLTLLYRYHEFLV